MGIYPLFGRWSKRNTEKLHKPPKSHGNQAVWHGFEPGHLKLEALLLSTLLYPLPHISNWWFSHSNIRQALPGFQIFFKDAKNLNFYINCPNFLKLVSKTFFFNLLYLFFYFYFFLFVVDFVIHWNETAMGLHVFPIPIPPPTSLSTRSL